MTLPLTGTEADAVRELLHLGDDIPPGTPLTFYVGKDLSGNTEYTLFWRDNVSFKYRRDYKVLDGILYRIGPDHNATVAAEEACAWLAKEGFNV